MKCMKVDNKSVIKPLFRFLSRSNRWENETEMGLHISVIIKELQEGILKLQGCKFLIRISD